METQITVKITTPRRKKKLDRDSWIVAIARVRLVLPEQIGRLEIREFKVGEFKDGERFVLPPARQGHGVWQQVLSLSGNIKAMIESAVLEAYEMQGRKPTLISYLRTFGMPDVPTSTVKEDQHDQSNHCESDSQ